MFENISKKRLFFYAFIILTVILVYIRLYHSVAINILDAEGVINHKSQDQKLISIDSENIEECFGNIEYETYIFNTNLDKISITQNKESTNQNKYILWFNGNNDSFCHPFITKHFIEKGYDIYAIDFPTFGFAQDGTIYNYYNNYNQIKEYIHAIINLIDSKYKGSVIRIGYGHSTGGLILLNYTKDYPKIFNKIILNSPLLDWYSTTSSELIPAIVIPILGIYSPKSDITGFYGTLNLTSISQLANDVRPYGYTIEYVKSVLERFVNTKMLSKEETLELNNHNERHCRYIICEDYFSNYFLIVQSLFMRIRKSSINTPALVLQSDKQSIATETKLDLADYGIDAGDNSLDIKEIDLYSTKILKNLTHNYIPEADHDVFYSKRESRELAIQYVKEFLI